MARQIVWDQQVGRRLKLRDLHIFLNVVQCGSMSRAAKQLNVSQPTISEAVADLEHAYGVRLLDRSPAGVEPTIYGRALQKRSLAAFDELKQSSLDIGFLADPGVGELRIGFQESLSPAFVAPLIRAFSQLYPRVVLHMDNLPSASLQVSELRARRYDCTLTLLSRPWAEDDITVDILFHDQLAIAANARSAWARRRRIELAELADEPWLLAPADTWNSTQLAEAFHARGLQMPAASLVTMSEPLRTLALSDQDCISAFTRSALRVNAKRFNLKMLPVNLPNKPWPVVMLSLKNRTVSPIVERFIHTAKTVAKGVA